MKLTYQALSHQGRRTNNEDAQAALPELGLFLVADGMGGYEGGEVASRLAKEAICEFVAHNATDREATWPVGLDRALSYPENLVRAAVHLADRVIHAHKEGQLNRMGSTVAVLLLQKRHAIIGHVGDSRIYRLRNKRLARLTRDHSLCEEAEGLGPEEREALRRQFGNVITRALGTPTARPELRREGLLPGDVFLICSDGLLEQLDDEHLAEVLRAMPPAEACASLVEQAYERGSKDNITAVVVAVEGVG